MLTPTTKTKRDRARGLIEALLRKTTANGCTEDEATKAAAKASELMLAYDLTYDDVQELRDEEYSALRRKYGRGAVYMRGRGVVSRTTWHEAVDTASAISEFTDTKIWRSGIEIVYFGRKQDCEIAHYLLDMFVATAEAEWQAFRRRGTGNTSISGRKDFMRGMIHRLNSRLREMAQSRAQQMRQAEAEREEKKRHSPNVAIGYSPVHAPISARQSLVVIKKEIVKERFEEYSKDHAVKLRSGRRIRRAYSAASGNYSAGRAAGDRVNITTGVGKE
jgi:Protein of unknown function (DUF2786)